MVDRYADPRVRQQASMVRMQERLQEALRVVPLALDLGTLRLYRAQAMSQEPARDAELVAAEKTFLAVQGVAGDSQRYRKELGQIYYWLGKPEKGKALFDALLADEHSDGGTYAAVAEIYRELGMRESSLSLYQQAYDNLESERDRFSIARIIGTIVSSVEDKEKWLKLSDPQSQLVKAELLDIQVSRAIRDGKEDEAVKLLSEQMALYAGAVQSAANINNFALAAFRLYDIDRASSALTKAREAMLKAAELDPSNGIVLSNAAENLLKSALIEHQTSLVDLDRIEFVSDYGLYDALWRSSEGRQRLVDELAKRPGVEQAQAYLMQALVLTPPT